MEREIKVELLDVYFFNKKDIKYWICFIKTDLITKTIVKNIQKEIKVEEEAVSEDESEESEEDEESEEESSEDDYDDTLPRLKPVWSFPNRS